MLLADTCLYLILALYLDSVVSSDFGRRRQPCFCLSPFWWLFTDDTVGINHLEDDVIDDRSFEGDDIEHFELDLECSNQVIVHNVFKTYHRRCSPDVEIIKGISMKMCGNEITAILGPPSVGKTTFLHMLCGMTSITSGKVVVFGQNVTKDEELNIIHSNIGFCSQTGILCREMTPREHLTFYGRIRGMEEEDIENETNMVLEKMELVVVADKSIENLSQSQQRKSGFALAMMGESKFIVLDEPTSGMDPESRQLMWNYLLNHKEGKVIIVATKFADEAEMFADRIAILTHGKLRAYGTPKFLINSLRLGYRLTINLDFGSDVPKLRSLVTKHIPEATSDRSLSSTKATMTLPRESISKFQRLFSELEALGVQNYSVSLITIEEGFEKLCNEWPPLLLKPKKIRARFLTKGMKRRKIRKKYRKIRIKRRLLQADDQEMMAFHFDQVTLDPFFLKAYFALVWLRFFALVRRPSCLVLNVVLPAVLVVLGAVRLEETSRINAGKASIEIVGGIGTLGLGLVIIPVNLALELIKERTEGLRTHLRLNANVGFELYYSSIFSIYYGLMLLPYTIILVMLALYMEKSYESSVATIIFAIFIQLYVLPAFLFSACASYLFKSSAAGSFMYPIPFALGFIPLILVCCGWLQWTYQSHLQPGEPTNYASLLHAIFLFACPFYTPFGIFWATLLPEDVKISKTCPGKYPTDFPECYDMHYYFSHARIYLHLVALSLHILIWGMILVFLECEEVIVGVDEQKIQMENTDTIEDEDLDVNEERLKIKDYFEQREKNPNIRERLVALNQARKVYKFGSRDFECKRIRKKVALRNFSLGLEPSEEIFGIVGPEGSGKSTILKLLCGEEIPTLGRVKIGDKEIHSQRSEGLKNIGYCSQDDILWNRITIQEHFEHYALMKGVQRHEVARIVDGYLKGLHIKHDEKKYPQDCSRTTQCKLSYGLAMMGDPRVVLFDDLYSRIEVKSRQFIALSMTANFMNDRIAILTTDSIYEAVRVCSRIGILVGGELRCLGTATHLRQKFAMRYVLKVRISADSRDQWQHVVPMLRSIFNGHMLEVERYTNLRCYVIPAEEIPSLAKTFAGIERVKLMFDIQDYSLSQMSLEEVYRELCRGENDSSGIIGSESESSESPPTPPSIWKNSDKPGTLTRTIHPRKTAKTSHLLTN